MNENLSEIIIIMDRSGSMSGIATDMEGAVKKYLEDMKSSTRGDIRVTLAKFDDLYEIDFENKPIEEVGEINLKPRGVTALWDAIGKTINRVEERLSAIKEEDKPGKCLFVIITDGCENASKEFKGDVVSKMIESKKKEVSWNFTFLGSNQDAIKEGSRIGVSKGSSMNYEPTAEGLINMRCSLASFSKDYFSTGYASYDGVDDED